jgi:hypothetical protein
MHALLLDGEEGVQNLSGPLPSIIAELAYDMAEVMIQERMKRLMQRQETRHQELLALADLSENRGGK